MIGKVVSFTGKVYPFRMPELVAHKVEIGFSREAERQKADDLMAL
jgi:hypothetical protein